jgi:hypothetical protein
MSGRQDRLGRLRAIRQLCEGLDRRNLQLALAAVAEVEAAMKAQYAARMNAGTTARAALTAGDRGEWLLADAQIEVAGWNRGRLVVLQRVRASEVAPAMERFLESRREHEQVKQLVDAAKQASKIEDDRRVQATADDWFLSRRARARE